MKLLLLGFFTASLLAQEPTLSPDALYSRGRASMLPPNPDYAKAADFFRQAADRGLPRAQRSLGELYRDGRGVPKDLAEAVKLFRKAADRDDAVAQSDLARMYSEGSGVRKDDKQAVKWFKKAAENGDAAGQVGLGVMYANGRGISRNPREALRWYQAAAEQGTAVAQFALGSIYEGDFGNIPRDRDQAIHWYTKALQQGFEPARAPLTALRNKVDPPTLTPDEATANLLTKIIRVDPELARAARIKADVLLRIVVDTEGRVKERKIISGHPLVNGAAMDTVLPLRYKPYLVNGQPSEFTTTITIKYEY